MIGGIAMGLHEILAIEEKTIEQLSTCYDPEIPVNIYDLGLIYGINVSPEGEVDIKMTLTSPNCPAAASLPQDVESKVKAVPGVKAVRVEIVWDPPWDQSRMSERARLNLGFM